MLPGGGIPIRLIMASLCSGVDLICTTHAPLPSARTNEGLLSRFQVNPNLEVRDGFIFLARSSGKQVWIKDTILMKTSLKLYIGMITRLYTTRI
jgi:hypothetical protein